jgi:hypothetical protein
VIRVGQQAVLPEGRGRDARDCGWDDLGEPEKAEEGADDQEEEGRGRRPPVSPEGETEPGGAGREQAPREGVEREVKDRDVDREEELEADGEGIDREGVDQLEEEAEPGEVGTERTAAHEHDGGEEQGGDQQVRGVLAGGLGSPGRGLAGVGLLEEEAAETGDGDECSDEGRGAGPERRDDDRDRAGMTGGRRAPRDLLRRPVQNTLFGPDTA